MRRVRCIPARVGPGPGTGPLHRLPRGLGHRDAGGWRGVVPVAAPADAHGHRAVHHHFDVNVDTKSNC